MKKSGLIPNLKETFSEGKNYKFLLLSILATGLSYGLYKGMLDNYLSEIVNLGETGRGAAEFFREIPGVMLVLILALFYMLSAETLYKAGAIFLLAGMGMMAILPPGKVLVILSITMYSMGEHIQIGMKNTLSLKYARSGHGGAALGAQNAATQIGTLVGYIAVVVAFSALASTADTYKIFFAVAAVLAVISAALSFGITGKSETDSTKRRFYFHKKYTKYYMLEMFYGARKQVFFTFGPYVLIRFYGADAAKISFLFAVSAVLCFVASPIVGRIIDRIGYKTVMVADTLLLVIVCFFYGFAHHIFSHNVAFVICCVAYVLDSIISLASMASNIYVQDLADNQEEVKATISTGVSINHLITIFIALCGGWIWEKLCIELLFFLSAFLGLGNRAYAATIKTKKRGKV